MECSADAALLQTPQHTLKDLLTCNLQSFNPWSWFLSRPGGLASFSFESKHIGWEQNSWFHDEKLRIERTVLRTTGRSGFVRVLLSCRTTLDGDRRHQKVRLRHPKDINMLARLFLYPTGMNSKCCVETRCQRCRCRCRWRSNLPNRALNYFGSSSRASIDNRKGLLLIL